MSEGQPTYSRDWYRQQQRDHQLQIVARRREAEERVHAILGIESELTARALLHMLVSADPVQALEMLVSGGHGGPGEDSDRRADLDTASDR